MHVTRGPTKARQKKLFYVYGHGWDAKDGLRVKPTLTTEEGEDFSWPQLRVPNDLYYNLHFTKKGKQLIFCHDMSFFFHSSIVFHIVIQFTIIKTFPFQLLQV